MIFSIRKPAIGKKRNMARNYMVLKRKYHNHDGMQVRSTRRKTPNTINYETKTKIANRKTKGETYYL